MRFLLNATTLRNGGGLQVGASVLNHALGDSTIDWRVALSPELAGQLRDLGIARIPHSVTLSGPPSSSRAARKELLQFEERESPSAVLTVFGPTYVRFRAPHLMGVADGWVTHSGSLAFRRLGSMVQMAKVAARCVVKGLSLRHADRWWVEAECSRRGLHSRLGILPDAVDVIPNTCSDSYRESALGFNKYADPEVWRVLTFATAAPHKNHLLLPRIAARLRSLAPACQVRHVVTLPHQAPLWRRLKREAKRLGVEDWIENRGPVALADGPALYRGCDLSLAPSLLETSSAVYPEAMAMGHPIVTTDLAFARDACGPAALYYRPLDEDSAARCLLRLISDASLRHELRTLGRSRLASRPDARERYECLRSGVIRLAARVEDAGGSSRAA